MCVRVRAFVRACVLLWSVRAFSGIRDCDLTFRATVPPCLDALRRLLTSHCPALAAPRQARDDVKCYWGYMRLLQHALFKLPKCGAGTIFRGIKAPSPPITLAQLDEAAASGEPRVWWGFSSTSTSLKPGWHAHNAHTMISRDGGGRKRSASLLSLIRAFFEPLVRVHQRSQRAPPPRTASKA